MAAETSAVNWKKLQKGVYNSSPVLIQNLRRKSKNRLKPPVDAGGLASIKGEGGRPYHLSGNSADCGQICGQRKIALKTHDFFKRNPAKIT